MKKKLKKSELPKTMRLEATKKVKEIISISDFLTPKMSEIFKKNLTDIKFNNEKNIILGKELSFDLDLKVGDNI